MLNGHTYIHIFVHIYKERYRKVFYSFTLKQDRQREPIVKSLRSKSWSAESAGEININTRLIIPVI